MTITLSIIAFDQRWSDMISGYLFIIIRKKIILLAQCQCLQQFISKAELEWHSVLIYSNS